MNASDRISRALKLLGPAIEALEGAEADPVHDARFLLKLVQADLALRFGAMRVSEREGPHVH
jgi:hypothetical protein